jgi:hypothetical protein
MRRLTLVIAMIVLVLSPRALFAQSDGLAGLLLQFFSPNNPIDLLFTGHQAHFTSQGEATTTLNLLNRNIAYQTTSFPLGSSSGGFTFTLDPSVGVLTRTSDSFGPLFAERALTGGKGKFTLGTSYVHSTYDKFEGNDLTNGDIVLTLTHQDLDNSGDNLTPFFEGDVIDAKLFLELTTDTSVIFANYGVTDRLDVGVAIPFVRAKLDARVHTSIVRDSTGREPFLFHEFDPEKSTGCGASRVSANGTENDYCESGDASGIGDLVVRAKLGLHRGDSVNLAAGLDLRLPTGKEEDLLGSGSTQAKIYLIASGGAKKRFSPHVNVGYTYTGDSDLFGKLPDEFDYTVGFDAAPSNRVTIMADFVGRSLLDAERLVRTQRNFPFRLSIDPNPPFSRERIRPFLATETGTLNLFLGSAGIKFNPVGRLLVSANLLFSLSQNNGLQDKLTPVFSVDYNF